ncbi:class I SAM-dependent methyltransferase [Paenibacillus aquistagni]|uniref:Methyltransferase domain-containing protein n=1 Tax=Paenibacillus aquistagni TaxID=1852522 RepID=A0A1X7LRQ4_9BACL|nr:SAM-dependent methyltransferase [Paenibacillus aquistagni]SMG55942.1 Methyltransferase domain-containing protein [Paenibacillus aquistagni]
MEQLHQLLQKIWEQESLHSAVISQVRSAPMEGCTKATLKPVQLRGDRMLQVTYQVGSKVVHENVDSSVAVEKWMGLMENHFRQALIRTTEAEYQVLISKKHKVSIKTQAKKSPAADLSHNRKKQYILEEGVPAAFLLELGIMTASGNVVAAKFDKFKQINRFLEMVADVLPYLPSDRPISIIDFGCGKSYLTFALYHYLHVLQKRDVMIYGLDLKADVIKHCEALARRLQYDGLQFAIGDIADYDRSTPVDMVVTLHACDTATDAALNKAVRWGAEVILSVPCCQHELFSQIDNEMLTPLLKHGILKERFSALTTDALRANLLDCVGYQTQLLEFIDMEHTPKNILIRAVKSKQAQETASWQQYIALRDGLKLNPYLERALKDILDTRGFSS